MSICLKTFIKEIRLRECIWNTQTKGYTNKIARRNAWKQIMEALNPDWATTTTAEERYKLKRAYIKKWKNIKDYYYRCKFRNAGTKRRNPYYFKAMSFLDAIKESKDTSRNVDNEQKAENSEHYTEDSDNLEDPLVYLVNEQYEEESDITPASTPEPTYGRSSNKNIEQKPIPTSTFVTQSNVIRNRDQAEEECNSNKHFLLSLVSDMDKMDDNQNLDFRLSVLTVIKNIKNNGVY